jgi:phage antirepressor YoqD-like protein
MVQVFNFNDNEVTFRNEKGIAYVNVTEMAKPFNKRPNDYLNLPSSKELVKAITRKNGNGENQLVITKRGGIEKPGTWLYEDIALDFAQWLSVDFKLWCNDRIKEILKYGFTGTDTAIDKVLNDPDFGIKLLTQLKEERAEKQRLEEQNKIQSQQLQISAPKVQYYDQVLSSSSTYVTDQIAKELGMTAISLNRKLKEMKVQFKRGDQWVLTSKYLNRGYTDTKTHPYTKSDGSTGSTMWTVWTEAGRQFIHEALKV